jgi:SAM-dependent methyltransferase
MEHRMTRSHHRLLGAAATNPSLLALMHEIRRSLKGCETVLDVGCGELSPLRFVHGVQLVGVDGYAPAVERARQRGTHDEYVLGDVKGLGTLFPVRRFDACVALDVIEHLPKEDGWRMLEGMERLATKRVIIFTPNGFVPQHSKDGDLQEHLSGWLPDEMRARGYIVVGMHGPKSLRGEYARLKHRPKVFWGLVSVLAHYLHTRRRPEKAFSLFCCKHKDGN